MNLSNFENFLDEVIIKRGRDYFENENIQEMKETGKNQYIVDVKGTKGYTVTIHLNGAGDIMFTACSCPYDFGDFCKHQVAAFYALRTQIEGGTVPIRKKVEDLETVLKDLPKEELVKIIIDYSNEHEEMKKKLLFTYAPVEDEVAAAKKLIRECINSYKRRGFIGRREAFYALEGARVTLEKAHSKIDSEDSESAVRLALAVLSISVGMFQYSDDSDGYIGDVISEVIKVIELAIFSVMGCMDEKEKSAIFTALVRELRHKRYREWDLHFDLLQTCIPLCDNSTRRNKLEKELVKGLEAVEEGSIDKYKLQRIRLIQLEILKRFESKEKAFQFMLDHVNLSDFREMAIKNYLETANYSEVLKLCEDGKKVDKELRGLVSKWKQYELEAYKGLGNLEKQREYTMDFLMGGDFKYYNKLKNLYEASEWQTVLGEILCTFEEDPHLPRVYEEILIEEGLKEKLLGYLKKSPWLVESLFPHLLEDYPKEVSVIFRKFIEEEAEQQGSRNQYRKVCKKIMLYKKVCGGEDAEKLIEYLEETYKKRPTFLDELSKVK